MLLCAIMSLDVKMSDAKKRKKSYYCQVKRHCGRRQVLDVGLKGFLITCNRMEKQTVHEAYNLLNEYSYELYGEVCQPYLCSCHNDMCTTIHVCSIGNWKHIWWTSLLQFHVDVSLLGKREKLNLLLMHARSNLTNSTDAPLQCCTHLQCIHTCGQTYWIACHYIPHLIYWSSFQWSMIVMMRGFTEVSVVHKSLTIDVELYWLTMCHRWHHVWNGFSLDHSVAILIDHVSSLTSCVKWL